MMTLGASWQIGQHGTIAYLLKIGQMCHLAASVPGAIVMRLPVNFVGDCRGPGFVCAEGWLT